MILQNELFKSLELNGDKIAIDNGEKQMSYSELLFRSNQITHFLLNKNLKKETLVGIQLKNRTDIICSILGVINAGCTFVLIDDSLPANRILSIIKDLSLEYLISSRLNNVKNVNLLTLQNIYIEEIQTIENFNDVNFPQYDANDSLYIYFTSGSTGKPKGIVGKNCSLLQFTKWEIECFNIDNSFKVSQFISPYFDAFLRDIFVPLMAGGTICIPPTEKDFFSEEKMIKWIDNNKINLIHCVPSVFRIINTKNISDKKFLNLRYVLLSGEKIIPSELTNWYKTFGSRIQLVNMYGTTETTMIRSYYKINPEDISQPKISIGKSINDTELIVADKNFKQCNHLVTGDLYILSDYVTKGYLNSPELTHEKFLKINSGTEKEVIAFNTGDRARILPNGVIDLIGREDRQIKLRGIRIEIDEIESILCKCPVIKNVVVTKDSRENGDEFLIAFVVKKDELSESINNQIQLFIEKELPEYMIPSRIIEIKEIPLLSNGKINYRELLTYLNETTIVAPENEIETKILSIWKEILGDKPISTEESFHSLGGNSISIMSLIGKLYKEFNVRISLSEIFNNFTIKKQAAYIKNANKDQLFIINRSDLKPTYNLSSAQERIYYNYQLNKNSIAYNLPLAWEIEGEFDKNKIVEVLKVIIERHESLRTNFKFVNGQICQVINDKIDFEIRELVTNGKINDTIKDFIKPFDLENGPLIRCGLVTTKENQKILIVDLHHIICDGMSQVILLTEFMTLYNNGDLGPLDIQYKDYAEWEYNFKTTEEYISYREFWLRNFEGNIPKLKFPIKNANTKKMSDKGCDINFNIDHKEMSGLIGFLRDEELTTFSGLFAIYFIYLSQLTGQDDIVIGVNTIGRMQEELENVVGMFTKSLPIRYKINANDTFKDFIRETHKYLIEANSKQFYDLTDIVRELNKNRSIPIDNLFETMFVFQNYESNNSQVIDKFSRFNFEGSTSKFPLTLFLSENENSFNFRFEYSTEYFTDADMKVIILQFKKLVKQLVEGIDNSISEIINKVPENLVLESKVTFNF